MTNAKAIHSHARDTWLLASAAAAGWCTAALLVGVTGVLIAQGHDGLAYTLGVSGAVFLWAALFVPAMAGSPGAASIAAYLSARHASPATGVLSSLVLLTALAGLLAAELTALAGVLGLAGLAAPLALPVTIAVAGAGFALAASGRAGTSAAAIFAVLVAVVLLTTLVAVSYRDGPGALVSIPAMGGIAELEQALLEKRIADPATFKPHAVPFLRTDALNFAMLIVCLSLGLAMLASPRVAQASANPSPSDKLPSRALLLVIGILLLLPPLAAAAKRALLALFGTGVRPAALPDWMTASLQAGLLQICGSASADPATLAKACGKGVGPQGLMRWHEAVFASDALLFAGIQAAAPAATILIAVIAALTVIAALWTAHRIASLVIGVSAAQLSTPALSKPLALLILLAAALIAYAKPADTVTLMTWSASLAAAALAPAMLAAIFASKPSALAANAAILVGAITALAMILATRYAPLELASWTNALASAPPAVARKLSTLQDAWAAAADGPGKDALLAQAEKLARDNLNWFGVKPVSVGIFGLVLGGIVVLAGAVGASLTRGKASK